MPRQLVCAEVTGECDEIVTGDDDEEILDQAMPHAQEAHGFAPNTALRETLRASIKDA